MRVVVLIKPWHDLKMPRVEDSRLVFECDLLPPLNLLPTVAVLLRCRVKLVMREQLMVSCQPVAGMVFSEFSRRLGSFSTRI